MNVFEFLLPQRPRSHNPMKLVFPLRGTLQSGRVCTVWCEETILWFACGVQWIGADGGRAGARQGAARFCVGARASGKTAPAGSLPAAGRLRRWTEAAYTVGRCART